MLKKTFTIALMVVILTLAMVGGVFAKDTKYIEPNANVEIVKVYRVTENGIKEVSIEEYLAHKTVLNAPKEFSILNKDSITPMFTDYLIYDEDWSQENIRLFGERVTPYLENTTPNPAYKEIDMTATESYSINISVNSSELAAIQAGMSIGWVSSASVSDHNGMWVDPGYKGYFRFDPIINRTHGHLKEYVEGVLVSDEVVQMDCPNKLSSGLLDGYFVACQIPI